MAPSPATAQTAPGPRHSLGYNLGVIALTVTMAALGLAYGLSSLVRSNARQSPDTLVTRSLVGRQLNIPAGWLRGGTAVSQGFASRIDLSLEEPLGAGGAPSRIDVMLVPLSQAQPSTALLDGVYLHQFGVGESGGVPGLVGKPLGAAEGFAGETVWYDPLSGSPFVAKCSDAPGGSGPAQCLRTVALPGGIAAVFSFGGDVLPAWKQFDPALGAALRQIGAL